MISDTADNIAELTDNATKADDCAVCFQGCKSHCLFVRIDHRLELSWKTARFTIKIVEAFLKKKHPVTVSKYQQIANGLAVAITSFQFL